MTADEIDDNVEDLARVLCDCVHDGASVGFVLPYGTDDARTYWTDNVRHAVSVGTRVLLGASVAGRIVGTAQLDCAMMPNQAHRAEVMKLLVHPAARRRGLARALMLALEAEANRLGRTLLTLDTASADKAEPLYRSLGYATAGSIPGYARDPIADRRDPTVFMYKQL